MFDPAGLVDPEPQTEPVPLTWPELLTCKHCVKPVMPGSMRFPGRVTLWPNNPRIIDVVFVFPIPRVPVTSIVELESPVRDVPVAVKVA